MCWELRQAKAADGAWVAELKAETMRADLERLGRWDPVRARQRVLDRFDPQHTWIIRAEGTDRGSIAARPEPDSWWIEHFYLHSSAQGRGVGGAVLRQVLQDIADHRPVRLDVLQGSAARRLYERHGFVLEREDPIDVFLIRHPVATTSTS